jgi:glutaredoxin
MMHHVVIYSKPGCHLCDEVKAQLNELRQSHPFELQEINILEDLHAYDRFKEEIPVIFINGKKAFKYHLDEKKFIERLASRG